MPFLEYNIFKRSLILLITFSCFSQTMVSNGSKQCNIVELYINLWLKLNVWQVIQVYFHYSGLLIKLYSYHGKPLLNWQEFQCIVLFFQCDAATRTFLRVHLVGHSLGWAAFCTSHYSYKDILFYFFECDSDHQNHICPPTHCFEQKYIPHIPGTFISALTHRPTRLAAECQSPVGLPAGVLRFLNWSGSLLYTCDLISAFC